MKAVCSIWFLMVCVTAGMAGAQDMSRAMWVWEYSTRQALNDAGRADALLDFAEARNIGTLYLYADSFEGTNDLTENPALYRAFLGEAHARGMEVQALLGSAALSTWEYILPEKRADALAMVSHVLQYNESSPSTERFDGLNIDIEPYLLPDWWASQPAYSHLYLQTLTEQKALVNASGQSIEFTPVIPRWLDTHPLLVVDWNGDSKPLSQHVQDLSDSVAIMDYRNSAGQIVNDAMGEIQYADQTGKRVIVGVETGASEFSQLSFYGFTVEEMEGVLSEAEAELATHPSYDGFAIHHYGSYQELTSIPEADEARLLVLGLLTVGVIVLGRGAFVS